MNRVLAVIAFSLLNSACTLSAQIKCELIVDNKLVITGKHTQHKIDISRFASSADQLFFYLDQQSNNRFRLFVWKFTGSNTVIDNINFYVGTSLEFDWVDTNGYGITEEGQRSFAFYGRDQVTAGGRVFSITQINGFPRLAAPITLQPLKIVTKQ